jgi:hypothetical protein
MIERDHLDELIATSCEDPSFAAIWKESEARLALAQLR